jgi:biotin carboxyl carrier protein
MGSAKVVSLDVRPLQASHLCFETDGILGQSDAQLGAAVTAFDFAGFYAILGSSPTTPADPSRLLYDFLEIQAYVSQYTIASLRAEPAKAALNKAINARQNAYFSKYANAPAVIAQINDSYSPYVPDSKPSRLLALSALADQQASELATAYSLDGRTGVVRTTNSTLDSTTRSRGESKETGQSNEENVSLDLPVAGNLPNPPSGGASFAGWTWQGPSNVELQEGSSGEKTTSTGSAREHQTIVNTDYGYRIPYIESQAQNQRAQISLIDQQFAQFMYSQNLAELAQVFANELSSIDSDVYRLQIAYLNTILMSPIAGTVTGIYKNPGDAVRAGEPVLRVENSSEILLVARLIYPSRISIGSTVTVESPLFEQPGPPTSIAGSVVAVRGERQDNQWEAIVNCDNLDGSGNPILPLGYHFDYDDTTVTVT